MWFFFDTEIGVNVISNDVIIVNLLSHQDWLLLNNIITIYHIITIFVFYFFFSSMYFVV